MNPSNQKSINRVKLNQKRNHLIFSLSYFGKKLIKRNLLKEMTFKTLKTD